jgi:hypothetical protein
MSDEETILVCAPVDGDLILPDNLVGRCDVCGCRVQFRPHAVGQFNRTRCAACTLALITPADEVLPITPQTRADVEEFFRKKRQ